MASFTTPGLSSSPSTITLLQTSSGAQPTATIVTGTAPVLQSSLSGSQQRPTISFPISVEYCEQVQVIWFGGDGPYLLVAYAPVSPTKIIAETNQTSWSFYNDFVSPGNILAISVSDNQGINTTSIYVVDGTNGTCSTDLTVTTGPTSTASIGTTGPYNNSDLPGTTIVGITFAVLAFLMVVGTAFWISRRNYHPQRVRAYVPNYRDRKSGDRSSVISGKSAGSARSARSALSLWSTFSNRQNINFQWSNAMEDGVRVHIDTIQVVEEPYSPMTVPLTSMAHFTPRRTTREWTGYGMAGNVRRDRVGGDSHAFNPSTIPEVTAEVEFPTHQIAKPGPSPFDDAYNVHDDILNGDVKSSPIASNTDHSEHDASQFSQRDLEALADIVAARPTQQPQHSPSPPQGPLVPDATEELPRYH